MPPCRCDAGCFELLGEDARGVIVQTYHGIAMRITGTSFADLAERGGGRDEALPFDQLIPDAIRLLRGETTITMKTAVGREVSTGEHLVHASIPQHERDDSAPYIVPPKDLEVRGEAELPGLALDELTDRLLSRFRHILVDEYQDIDESQYELISALAGRTQNDPDRKLTILAVGDDDQNIYTWRGANVEFIQRFREDYAAEIHYLVENYRSTGHIIAAANALIAHNRDRMKTDHPICRDHSRAEDPPGGRWAELDPLVQGRVQVLTMANLAAQPAALVEEWKRMRTLNPALAWSDMAVLARTRETLAPIRALCEHHDIPVTWGIDQKRSPALTTPPRNCLLPGSLEESPGKTPPGLGTAKPCARNGGNPYQESLVGAPPGTPFSVGGRDRRCRTSRIPADRMDL